MLDVAVNAAGAEQTHQVNRLARVDCRTHIAHQHIVFLHRAIHDGLGDQRQLLIDNAARAHVGMTDLAVAHLPLRKTDSHAGRLNGGIRIVFKQLIEVRLFRRNDCVAKGMLRHPAEAIHNAKQNRFLSHNCSFTVTEQILRKRNAWDAAPRPAKRCDLCSFRNLRMDYKNRKSGAKPRSFPD